MSVTTAAASDHPVRPSTVTLPPRCPAGVVTLLDFFAWRFPRVARGVWEERFAAGAVWSAAAPLAADATFAPGLVAHYRREVAVEPEVRSDWRVVAEDEHLLVVDKPPFLPVTPGGLWVRNCLLHLVGAARGEIDLAPLHRLDRLTSGLVVLSRRRDSRSHFSRLFQGPRADLVKRYTAVVELQRRPLQGVLELANHLAPSADEHWRQVVVPDRPANARLHLELVSTSGELAVVTVTPVTGRKHQLRVQLAHAGLPVANDPLYGTTPRHDPHDLSRRLGLDASALAIRAFPGWAGGLPLDAVFHSGRSGEQLLAEVRGEST